MSYDCSTAAFVKSCKYTLKLETFWKKIAQFKACKKYKNVRERNIFYVHCMKKLANDKTRIEMAELTKVSALRRPTNL